MPPTRVPRILAHNSPSVSESLGVIRALQSRWAQKIACDHTRPDYADTVSSNLFLTRLNSDTEGEFSRADGAELQDAGGKPAKMRALMSSSALAVNFFDSWRHAKSHRSRWLLA